MNDELASIDSPCRKTISKNIFKENKETLIQYNLKWNLLRCFTFLGDENMCGAQNGFLDEFTIYTTYANLLQ